MDDIDHDPLRLTDQDIATLLDETSRQGADPVGIPSDSALDVGALEALVLEEETSLATLLPGYIPGTSEAGGAEAVATWTEGDAAAAHPIDAPVLHSLNILFGLDHSEDSSA